MIIMLIPNKLQDSLYRLVVNDGFFIQMQDPVMFSVSHSLTIPFQSSSLVLAAGSGKVFGTGVAVDIFEKVGFVGENVDSDGRMQTFQMLVGIPGPVDGFSIVSFGDGENVEIVKTTFWHAVVVEKLWSPEWHHQAPKANKSIGKRKDPG